MIHHRQLISDSPLEIGQREMSSFDMLLLVMHGFEKKITGNYDALRFYYEQMLKALYNSKRKIDKQDKKTVIQIMTLLLSHFYKKHNDLSKTALLCLERVLLGFPIILNVNIKNTEELNKELI